MPLIDSDGIFQAVSNNYLMAHRKTRTEIIGSSTQELVGRCQIEQVLLNVYINAWQAMPGSGTLTVQAASVHLDSSAVAAYRLSAGRSETVRSERAVTKNQ